MLNWRNALMLVAFLGAGKLIVVGAVYFVPPDQVTNNLGIFYSAPVGLTSVLQDLATKWDGVLYQQIASGGYPPGFAGYFSKLYAFSPVYPALIYALRFLTGSYWTSSLVATNIFSFVFPLILLELFDFRTALITEMFPTYLVYTTVGYSDALALTFLGLGLLSFVKRRYALGGLAVGAAALVLYDLLLAAPAFLIYMLLFQKVRSVRPYLGFLLPVLVAAISILVAYQVSTGDVLLFFQLEKEDWGVVAASPLGQIQWLINASGPGSFGAREWTILGLTLSPAYWIVRNVLFEAFFFLGIVLLTRIKDPHRWLYAIYSGCLSIPLLFLTGTPAYSIPRLLLAAFPVFLGYSQLVFTNNRRVAAYVIGCLLVSVWVVLAFVYAFFA